MASKKPAKKSPKPAAKKSAPAKPAAKSASGSKRAAPAGSGEIVYTDLRRAMASALLKRLR
jgi:hypothetical protein